MKTESSEHPKGSPARGSRSVARRLVLSDQGSKKLATLSGTVYLEGQVNDAIWHLIESGSQGMRAQMQVNLKTAGMTKTKILEYLVRRGFSDVKLEKSRKPGIEAYAFTI
jgi:hypothetical protein